MVCLWGTSMGYMVCGMPASGGGVDATSVDATSTSLGMVGGGCMECLLTVD